MALRLQELAELGSTPRPSRRIGSRARAARRNVSEETLRAVFQTIAQESDRNCDKGYLSARELKQVLEHMGVDYSGAFEKKDLVQLILQNRMRRTMSTQL